MKIASATKPEDKKPESGNKKIQVEDQDKKEPVQESCKDQKTAKSKNWIRAIKVEVSRAKNQGQSRTFFISGARQTFTKLRQMFIEAPILNCFNPEYHIQIGTDAFGYD